MPSIGPYTVPLGTSDNAIDYVGGKGRSLSKLIEGGFDVPAGFLVPTHVYREFVAEHGLQDRILALTKPSILEGAVSFEDASLNIAQLFVTHEISPDFRASIDVAYQALSGEPPVAVRSSANAEDLPNLSFAGQQETYLNVSGPEAIIDAIKRCWASLWTAQAMNYRHEMGIDHSTVAMCVVVQAMVPSDVSGVLFTANPVTGDRSEMIVNASFGLGEAVVSGQVSPDLYVVDRQTQRLISTTIGEKAKQIVSNGQQGTRIEDIDERRRAEGSLSESLLNQLTVNAESVEQLFNGVPQDIEWAIADNRLSLLQARPITNLPVPPLKNVEWAEIPGAQLYKRMASEVMPEPLSPLFEDLYLKGLYDTQTWPEDWEWKGSHTRNFLSNFIIATVNGYAFQAIYVNQGEESRRHWEAFRKAQGPVPWYRVLQIVFSRRRATTPTARVDVNGDGGAARLQLLARIRGTSRHWIWVLYHWWRAFAKADAVTRWQQIDLPDYLSKLELWRGIDLSQVNQQTLLDGIEALTAAEARYWHVLRGIIGAAKMSDQTLQNFLVNNAEGLGLSSGIFLSGFASKTLEAEVDMRKIATTIRNDSELYELTLITPVRQLLDALRAHSQGRGIAGDIDRYLLRYGQQVFNLDFVEPTPAEDPIPFLTNLKAMVRHAGVDLDERQQAVAKKRRTKWWQAVGYFLPRRVAVNETSPYAASVSTFALLEFYRLLRTARINYPFREEAIFYMGKAWSLLRPIALELGSRFVASSLLEKPEDIFYLRHEELIRALGERPDQPVAELSELKQRASARHRLREQRKRLEQPAAIPKENQLKWASSGKSFDTIKVNDDGGEVIGGFAVSPGCVTGVASLIMSPDEFDQMQPDTILVCPLTTPAWTQLFPYAVGLVTDIGSITAHGSIVAREYGIPAVLGTGNGTRIIKHGQRITVDGDHGTVTLVDDVD